jgi:uncharacterized protein
MTPRLLEGEYVFCTFEHAAYGDCPELEPLAAYMEAEGLTLLIPRDRADAYGLPYEAAFKGLTLSVHSSLAAVGFTAAVASRLAEHHISANVIAAYYHDHIFIQAEQAEHAIEALRDLAPSPKN